MKRTEQDITLKSMAIGFIGLMVFISIHTYFEYQLDHQSNPSHECLLCHQVMIEASPETLVPELNVCINNEVLVTTNEVFIKQVELKHLYPRGPPQCKLII